MKIVRLVVVLAVALSICFCGIYLKFFSTINSYINTYIVQVGIYKQDENANEMIKKLSDLGKPNYKYQKDNNFVVITGVFLDEKEAKDMGNTISESGITCVIKQTKFESSFKEVIEKQDYEAIIIADHGNADHALNEDGTPNTAHSLNPVPCVYVTENKAAKVENGRLADVAPTILKIMGLEVPAEMDGSVLIK